MPQNPQTVTPDSRSDSTPAELDAAEKRRRRRNSPITGTTLIQAEAVDEITALKTAEARAEYAYAQAYLLASADGLTDGKDLKRHFATLYADGKDFEALLAELDRPGADPSNWLTKGDVRTERPRRSRPQRERAPLRSPIEIVLEHAGSSGCPAGFMRLPIALIHGEIIAKLERLRPGLGAMLIVLLRYGDRKEHIVTASKRTLSQECAISEDRTLDRRLLLLSRGDKKSGLPALLRKLPGRGVRFAFREEGLRALVNLARDTLEARQKKFAAIRRAQSAGGKRGMQTRWRTPPKRGQ